MTSLNDITIPILTADESFKFAEADALRQRTANLDVLYPLNVKRTKAHIRMAEAQADSYEAEAAMKKNAASQMQRQEDVFLAGDLYHHYYYFGDKVNGQSVADCIQKLQFWRRHDKNPEPIEICFTSPGGEIIQGLVLFDYIQQMKRAGYYVTTSTLGQAASMAAVLLQAGDTRIMNKESWMLIHQGDFGLSGSAGSFQDTAAWHKRLLDRLAAIFTDRLTPGGTLTPEEFKLRWERKEWWLDSSEALSAGLIDEVR